MNDDVETPTSRATILAAVVLGLTIVSGCGTESTGTPDATTDASGNTATEDTTNEDSGAAEDVAEDEGASAPGTCGFCDAKLARHDERASIERGIAGVSMVRSDNCVGPDGCCPCDYFPYDLDVAALDAVAPATPADLLEAHLAITEWRSVEAETTYELDAIGPVLVCARESLHVEEAGELPALCASFDVGDGEVWTVNLAADSGWASELRVFSPGGVQVDAHWATAR